MVRTARWCFRHRRLVVLLWVVGLLAIGAASGAVGSKYSTDFNLPNTESKKAIDLLKASAPSDSGASAVVVFNAKQGTLDDPANESQILAVREKIKTLPAVVAVGDPFRDENAAISQDRKIAFATVQWTTAPNDFKVADVTKFIDTAQSLETDSLQIELGGDIVRGGGGGGGPNEWIGLVAAAIVLFIAFGSIYTMFLPLVTAILAVGIGLSIVGFLTNVFSIAEFGPTLAALIGLGVGVDYALFVISRHRVNLQQGMDIEDSVVMSINTSGRAVLFAGVTVCIAMLGLFLLGISFLYGLALSVVVVVGLAVLAAITFLPAILGFVGIKALSRKNRKALAEKGPVDDHSDLSPGWFRWAKTIQRHSFALASVAIVVMLVLAAPFFSIRLGSPDSGGDPPSSTTRQSYDLLAKGFGAGFNGPLQVVAQVNNTSDLAEFATVTEQIKDYENVASVTPVVQLPGGNVAMVQVYPKSAPQDQATTDLITNLRKNVTHPFNAANNIDVYVGGSTAIFQDFTNVLAGKLPLFVGTVVIVSFILLMMVFRSLLIPLVASLMNLLSAAAAFGVIVAVFQWGWGADLIGLQQTGPILVFLPVLAFPILFGLSMDYEVFLVARIFEEWHKTNDNDEAITLGQAETGRTITAAAIIMVVVFGSFVLGGDSTIKLFGLGLAVAVFLDAFIVRSVLVPAIMHMIGPKNWYLPAWLDKILPHLNVEAKES